MDAGEIVLAVARRLVDRPERLRLERRETADGTALELLAAPDDRGKLIGRDGRTIRALRTLLAARDVRSGERHVLDVGDD